MVLIDLTTLLKTSGRPPHHSNPFQLPRYMRTRPARIIGLIADRRGISAEGIPPPGIEAAYVNAGELTAPRMFNTGATSSIL